MSISFDILDFNRPLPFGEEHALVRETARRFFENECVPEMESWEKAGIAPRELWARAAELGLLCARVPTEFGGLGMDFLTSIVLIEEQVRSGVIAPMFSLHSDVVSPYLIHYGTPGQQKLVLPNLATGQWVGAIAMTEPSGGSDLQAIRTIARKVDGGYQLNGQKTFISHGACADLIIVAAQTLEGETKKGVSLFLVHTENLQGFSRGAPFDKLGQKSADTTDLFFDDVFVPEDMLLGGVEGQGFAQLMSRLDEERLLASVVSLSMIERAIRLTVDYTKQRRAFGQRIIDFQNSRFVLANAVTERNVLNTFLCKCVRDFLEDKLTATNTAMLKWWATEQQVQIVDDCLQLHGGYGYILEYPIAKMWVDGRITKIYGGTNEIMKEIIGRSI